MDKAYQKEILTNYVRAVLNEDKSFIASQIAPFMKVNKDSGQMYDYGRQGMRIVEAGRAVGGRYHKVDFTAQLADKWSLDDHGLFAYILKEEEENAETPIQAKQAKAKLLMQIMMLNHESAVASQITTSTIAQNITLAGSSQWNDYTNSNPLKNIEDGKEAARKASGKKMNSIMMSRPVFAQLKRHPAILALFRNVAVVTDAMLESEILKGIFGFENVAIAEAQYEDKNLEQSPTETGNLVDIRGKKVLMYHSISNPGMYDTTFMRTFAKRNGLLAGAFAPTQEQGLTEKIVGWVVVEDKYDLAFIDSKCGYLIESAVA